MSRNVEELHTVPAAEEVPRDMPTGLQHDGGVGQHLQQQQHNNVPTGLTGTPPLDLLRSLYLGTTSPSVSGRIGQMLRRGSTSITFTTIPIEFPPVTRLDPFNKKRILVTGVSFS